jgi:cytidine deaminase
MDNSELVAAAKAAREAAYTPYSGYAVGAAVQDERNRIHRGCNVENASFGATICAERNAVASMVAHGGRSIAAVAVVTADGGVPCGMCLQVLAEFAPATEQVEVICVAMDGSSRTFKLSDLLPHAFRSDAVARTPGGVQGSDLT